MHITFTPHPDPNWHVPHSPPLSPALAWARYNNELVLKFSTPQETILDLDTSYLARDYPACLVMLFSEICPVFLFQRGSRHK